MAKPSDNMFGGPLPRQFGRYTVLKQLGKGGMGAVFLAHDTELDRDVALKVPLFAAGEDADVLERFFKEARSAATLQHAHICAIHDVGQIDGVHFISMAFIKGKPLSAFIRKDKPLSPRSCASVVRKVARILSYAHERGVVHRDLKPANIMIDESKQPVVMDFGLARRMNETEQSRITRSGMIVGSPAYMAPEQVRCDHAKIGPATDVYSLGVILYELLTGELPFQGTALSIVAQILTESPPPPSELRPKVDLELQAICLKMMAKELEERYASMDECDRVLAAYLEKTTDASTVGTKSGALMTMSLQTVAPPEPAQEEAAPGRSRRSVVVLLLVLAALLPVAGAALRFRVNAPTPTPPSALAAPSQVDPTAKQRLQNRERFAVRFDGEHSFVKIPSFHYSGDTPLTIEAIVTPAERKEETQLVVADADKLGFALGILPHGQWHFTVPWGSEGKHWVYAVSDELATPGRTVHLAATLNNHAMRLFVNGEPQGRESILRNRYPASNLSVVVGAGPRSDGTVDRHFHGLIHSVRASREVRYRERFDPPAELDADQATSLMLHFDDGESPTAADSGPHNMSGVVHGAVWTPEPKRLAGESLPPAERLPPANRAAVKLNGVDSHVALPISHQGGPVTLEAYVTPLSSPSNRTQAIICQEGANDGIGLNLFIGQYWELVIRGGRTHVARAIEPVRLNERVHVAGAFDGKTATLFVNGKRQGNPVSASLWRTGFPWLIGANPNFRAKPSNHFSGLVEQVRISRTVRYTEDFVPQPILSADEETTCLLWFNEFLPWSLDRSGNSANGRLVNAEWVRLEDEAK